MRHGLLFGVVLGAHLLFGTPRVAFAADPSPQDIAQARELAQQAVAAFDAGNFAESEKLWTSAAALYPAAPTLSLGLARAAAKLGHYVLAQESYNKIIREQSHNPNAPPAFKDALEAARAEVGAVSAKIASVVITVEGGAPNPVVTIDGQPVSAAGLGLKRPIDPGTHVVKAEAPGYKPTETTFEVAESGAATAQLKLEKDATAPLATTPPAPQPDSQPKSTATAGNKSPNKTLAIVAFGVGGAGLILGGVTGGLALGKRSELEEKCPNNK
ncbi:MAG TPA: PEGA domain-containing protein, partial [Labilithrix sp.]|nr:PEGA domain-containing protein [Labilithrix sp.]